MKRTITSLLAIAVLAAVAMFAPTAKHRFTALQVVHAERGCSNETLSGKLRPHLQWISASGLQRHVRPHVRCVLWCGATHLRWSG